MELTGFIYLAVTSITFGIISNILYPYVLIIFKAKPPKIKSIERTSEQIDIPEYQYVNEDLEKVREFNRRRLAEKIISFFSILFMYYLVVVSIYLPTNFSELFGEAFIDSQLYLINTRFRLDIVIPANKLLLVSTTLAIPVYYVYWFISIRFANIVSAIAYKYTSITQHKYVIYMSVGVGILSLIGAANLYYMLVTTSEYLVVLLSTFALVIGSVLWAINS